MLKGRSNRAVISEVPFMHGKDTLTRVSVVGLLCSSEVVGLLFETFSNMLFKENRKRLEITCSHPDVAFEVFNVSFQRREQWFHVSNLLEEFFA